MNTAIKATPMMSKVNKHEHPANYEVKDISLATQGNLNLMMAERAMGALMKVRADFREKQPFKGIRMGMALHVTKETGVLVRTLRDGGAEVAITGCNPLSTQDDVAAALAMEGVQVYAYKGESTEDYYRYLENVIRFEPQITIDDGCDLVSLIHKKFPHLLPKLIGGCEETTTGIHRLRAMEEAGALKYPIIAVNDNQTKHLMDNYYGTGQSTIDGLLRASNVLFAGKVLVVAGYGSCGKGVALRGKGMGSRVIITEVDNFRALQAVMDGFEVMPMNEAIKEGDIFVTVTGNKHVITADQVREMKAGAILANSGHFDLEIDVAGLEKIATSKQRVRPYFDEYNFGENHYVYLAGEGRLINLAAAEGHPSEVMSLSFCGQALACEYLIKNNGKLAAKVHVLPAEIDDFIAKLQLTAMGIKIDEMTSMQEKYMSSWEEGT